MLLTEWEPVPTSIQEDIFLKVMCSLSEGAFGLLKEIQIFLLAASPTQLYTYVY